MSSNLVPVPIRSAQRAPINGLSSPDTPYEGDRTSLMERYLLLGSIALNPIQDLLPTLGRFSVSYVLLALSLAHLLINRPYALKKTWAAPPFLALYALVFWGVILETWHPHTDYTWPRQIGEMTVGAVLIASLCRDRAALRVSLYGYLLVGTLIAIIIYPTCYGVLSNSNATDFMEATNLREQALEGSILQINANRMALYAAQASVVALALGLYARSSRQRLFLFGLCLFCLVATFLPVSRSGAICVMFSCATVFLAYRGRGKLINLLVVGVVLGGAIFYLVPSSVFSRMSYTSEAVNGKKEGRAQVYTASIERIPDYAPIGIGAGNFWEEWGINHGFTHQLGTETVVLGAHNAFFQVTIYWGVIGLLLLLTMIGLTYLSLPRKHREDVLALGVYGIAASVLILMFSIHALHAKEYSLGLGVVIGARLWIWRDRQHSRITEEIAPWQP